MTVAICLRSSIKEIPRIVPRVVIGKVAGFFFNRRKHILGEIAITRQILFLKRNNIRLAGNDL